MTSLEDNLRVLVSGRAVQDVDELCLDGVAVKDGQLAGLGKYTALVELSLIDSKITSLQGFPDLPKLTKLKLNDNKVADTAPLAKAKLGALETLELSYNRITKIEDLKPLESIKSLRTLDVQFNDITKVAGYRDQIFALMPHLEVVDERDKEGKERLLADDEEDDEEEEEEENEDGDNGSDSEESETAPGEEGPQAGVPMNDDESSEEGEDEDEDEGDDGEGEEEDEDEDGDGEAGEDGGEEPVSASESEEEEEDDGYRNILLGNVTYEDNEGEDGDFMPNMDDAEDLDIAPEDDGEDMSLPAKHDREGLDDLEPSAKRR